MQGWYFFTLLSTEDSFKGEQLPKPKLSMFCALKIISTFL